ncbi:hypothetical protein CRENBAI_012208 [Crenichthys baileyi]|uniref:Uncharacterized protein n=1 Tax=Crenichthys baileyi TaxID=28760 RepID=A0AAV9S5A9_9TELE
MARVYPDHKAYSNVVEDNMELDENGGGGGGRGGEGRGTTKTKAKDKENNEGNTRMGKRTRRMKIMMMITRMVIEMMIMLMIVVVVTAKKKRRRRRRSMTGGNITVAEAVECLVLEATEKGGPAAAADQAATTTLGRRYGRGGGCCEVELRTFVGLLESGRAIFAASMPLKCFYALSALVRFDDRSMRAERRAQDKLNAVRELRTRGPCFSLPFMCRDRRSPWTSAW